VNETQVRKENIMTSIDPRWRMPIRVGEFLMMTS